MKALGFAILTSIVVIASPAESEKSDPSCLTSAASVRKVSPDSWPTYTLRMPGHESQKCWFPTTKQKRHSVTAERIKHRILAMHTPKSRIVQMMVEQRPLKAEVVGSSPAAAAIAAPPQRTRLRDWQGVMSGNAYVALMWP